MSSPSVATAWKVVGVLPLLLLVEPLLVEPLLPPPHAAMVKALTVSAPMTKTRFVQIEFFIDFFFDVEDGCPPPQVLMATGKENYLVGACVGITTGVIAEHFFAIAAC